MAYILPWDRDGSLAKRIKEVFGCIVLECKPSEEKQNKEKYRPMSYRGYRKISVNLKL